MVDGWYARFRGPGWGRKHTRHERVEWHEIKTGVFYLLDQAARTKGGRGMLMDLLTKRGATVEYLDPYVPVIRPTREHGHWAGKKSVSWDQATIGGFDGVLISTNHACVNCQELAEWSPLIVDSRNAMVACRTKPGQIWKA